MILCKVFPQLGNALDPQVYNLIDRTQVSNTSPQR